MSTKPPFGWTPGGQSDDSETGRGDADPGQAPSGQGTTTESQPEIVLEATEVESEEQDFEITAQGTDGAEAEGGEAMDGMADIAEISEITGSGVEMVTAEAPPLPKEALPGGDLAAETAAAATPIPVPDFASSFAGAETPGPQAPSRSLLDLLSRPASESPGTTKRANGTNVNSGAKGSAGTNANEEFADSSSSEADPEEEVTLAGRAFSEDQLASLARPSIVEDEEEETKVEPDAVVRAAAQAAFEEADDQDEVASALAQQASVEREKALRRSGLDIPIHHRARQEMSLRDPDDHDPLVNGDLAEDSGSGHPRIGRRGDSHGSAGGRNPTPSTGFGHAGLPPPTLSPFSSPRLAPVPAGSPYGARATATAIPVLQIPAPSGSGAIASGPVTGGWGLFRKVELPLGGLVLFLVAVLGTGLILGVIVARNSAPATTIAAAPTAAAPTATAAAVRPASNPAPAVAARPSNPPSVSGPSSSQQASPERSGSASGAPQAIATKPAAPAPAATTAAPVRPAPRPPSPSPAPVASGTSASEHPPVATAPPSGPPIATERPAAPESAARSARHGSRPKRVVAESEDAAGSGAAAPSAKSKGKTRPSKAWVDPFE